MADEPTSSFFDPPVKKKTKKDPNSKNVWDREDFEDRDEYEAYYVRYVDDLLDEAKTKWKPIKQRWMEADKRLELDSSQGSTSQRPTKTDLSMVPQAIEKAISMMIDSMPRPTVSPKQVSEEDMSGALNFFMNECLDQNNFDLLMATVALDMKRFNIGFIKSTIDDTVEGPFGQPVMIKLSKTDPRYVWPDVFAKSWSWDDMKYLIVAEPFDLADIRQKFPDRGPLVKAESTYSLSREPGDEESGEYGGSLEISSPTMNNGYTMGERKRALLKECWFHCPFTEFKPMLDNDGEPIKGEDGEPLGEEVKMYPHGRLIITAGKRVLFDGPIPFRHGKPPYTVFQNRLSTRLFSFGDVEILARLEDKLNVIHKDMMKNARVNMNSPYVIDNNAFDSPEKYKQLTNEETLVITKNPGSIVQRLPAQEFPQFVFPLISWLQEMFNDTSGVSNVMQGQIAKSSQLSADTLSNLQGSSAANLKLKGRLLENGIKELGYILQWLIRQFYSVPIEDSEQGGIDPVTGKPSPSGNVQMTDPSTGQPVQIKWNADEDQPDYAVDVAVGSSLPGSKQSAQQLAMQLYGAKAIDAQALLDALSYPGRGEIMDRRKKALQLETQFAMQGVQVDLLGNDGAKPGRKQSNFKGA